MDCVRRPRYLVIMRTGPSPQLAEWLKQEPQRNWDLWVSSYVDCPSWPEAIGTHVGGYNKFFHVWEAVKAGVLDLSPYSYVMLADDDLAITEGTVSAFFNQVEELELTVAHPAQSPEGFWSHEKLLHDPTALWRETTFVEVMCPCFSTKFLMAHLDTMPITFSTWGTDFAFCYLARAAGGRVGIIDTTVVRHLKPITPSGLFYTKLAAHGINPHRELQAVLDQLPPEAREIRVLRVEKKT